MNNMKNTEIFTNNLDREMNNDKIGGSIQSLRPVSNIPNRSGKILDTGWSSIPNCSSFEMEPRKSDPRWLKLGIDKRINTEPKMTPHTNKKMNQYIKFQTKRLELKRSNPVMFWKICNELLKNSAVFRTSAINHVCKNWYKSMKYYAILQANAKVSEIIRTNNWKIKYHRVYIPKGETHRPLGVPTLEWRIYLHMINNFMHIYVKPYLLPSQHGFIPGRGTLTAWKDIMTKILDKPFIYECDLKQFFPSVDVKALMDLLEKDLSIPLSLTTGFFELNSSLPVLPAEIKLDESYTKETKKKYGANKIEQEWDWADDVSDEYYNNAGSSGFLLKPDGNLEWFERPIGVPQGAPTSPLMSILILIKSFLTQTNSISYADDPIFYGDQSFQIQEYPELGINIHQGKSGWVKQEGKWLTNLKYLGLEYSWTEDSLSGNTRKGSRLKLTREYRDEIIKMFAPTKPLNWETLFNLKDIGMIFSRLYIGSWKSDAISQDFFLLPLDGSWLHRQWNRDKGTTRTYYNTFNVSSFACSALVKKITKMMKGVDHAEPLLNKPVTDFILINPLSQETIYKGWTMHSANGNTTYSQEISRPTAVTRKLESTPLPPKHTEILSESQVFLAIKELKETITFNLKKLRGDFNEINFRLIRAQQAYKRIRKVIKSGPLTVSNYLAHTILNTHISLKSSNNELNALRTTVNQIKLLVICRMSIDIMRSEAVEWSSDINRVVLEISNWNQAHRRRAIGELAHLIPPQDRDHYNTVLGVIRNKLIPAKVEIIRSKSLPNIEIEIELLKAEVENILLKSYKAIPPAEPDHHNWKTILGTNLSSRTKIFVASFFITIMVMVKQSRPLEILESTVPELYTNEPGFFSDLISWLLIFILIFLFAGVLGYYSGIITFPKPRSPTDISTESVESFNRAINSLRESNQDLIEKNINLSAECAKLKDVRDRVMDNVPPEGVEIDYSRVIESFQQQINSISSTLTAVRESNISLNAKLVDKSNLLETTSLMVSQTERSLNEVSHKLNSLMDNLKKLNHDAYPSTDDLNMLVECPALELLKKVSLYTDLDLGAILLTLSDVDPNIDPTKVLALIKDPNFVQSLNGINEIFEFINEYKEILDFI